ncbi:hypothetical protein [Leptolyngbya sp. O-77]|uniref:hypothetical protein n=1 Tax=Leptolyngbya sp. O-77 TaxID=1080068 RepID=UPI00074D3C88|nr:hypothetical protein [Leptolyngbya sp. O-77]BAU42141.1 hypothetical protein O77CONTIG1_01959 [Leptolyngbya sp. O-77]
MKRLEFFIWLKEVQDNISSSISGCSPRAWNEDHISYTWLQNITSTFSKVLITGTSSHFSIAWDAYKAEGAFEEDNGDIAVLVRLTFPERKTLTGVAFLEAKRSYSEAKRSYSKSRYRKLKWSQLEYQSSLVSNHRVLLYDKEPIKDCIANLVKQGYSLGSAQNLFQEVNAVVVPTPHVLALRSRAKNLSAMGLPLAYQLCCRYLQGLDLDFSSQLVSAVRAGVASGVKYLLVVHVVQENENIAFTDNIEIDQEYYRRIHSQNWDE